MFKPGDLGEVPAVRLPDAASLFSRRAERFRALGRGHVLDAYLELLARVCDAQVRAVDALGSPRRPVAPASQPLAIADVLDAEWRAILDALVRDLEGAPMPAPARRALTGLAQSSPEVQGEIARRIVAGDLAGLDLAAAPFVAAALQVRLTALAEAAAPEGAMGGGAACPLCGAPPVAGVVLGDDKLRYLVCSLCGCEWHLTRVKCSHCGSTAGISYLVLEGDAAGVKAEVCDACDGYLKLFYLDARAGTEALADDVATYALDLLVAERGYGKAGLNPFFLPGASA
jgi:FdhE protein